MFVRLVVVQEQDEDVVVDEVRSVVVNFAHSRHECRLCPYTAATAGSKALQQQRTAANKKHCEKCFCFVCDVEAGASTHPRTCMQLAARCVRASPR